MTRSILKVLNSGVEPQETETVRMVEADGYGREVWDFDGVLIERMKCPFTGSISWCEVFG